MAKRRPTRARDRELQGPPPVRIQTQRQPSRTTATLKQLLAAAGRVRQPGSIAIYSGVAQASASSLRTDLSDLPLPGWGWRRWTIGAPPAGSSVLWLTLWLAWQWWRYDSCLTATNTSGRYRHADFGVTWRWMLLPDQYDVPGAPASMQDGGAYEFYASKPPGGRIWTAWWVHPSRSVTLTPAGKESDPNALTLLLRSEQNGRLGLMFAFDFPWDGVTFDGYQARCYSIDGGPHADSLYYSMAVVTPKLSVTVGEVQPVGSGVTGPSGPLRRMRRRQGRSK